MVGLCSVNSKSTGERGEGEGRRERQREKRKRERERERGDCDGALFCQQRFWSMGERGEGMVGGRERERKRGGGRDSVKRLSSSVWGDCSESVFC